MPSPARTSVIGAACAGEPGQDGGQAEDAAPDDAVDDRGREVPAADGADEARRRRRSDDHAADDIVHAAMKVATPDRVGDRGRGGGLPCSWPPPRAAPKTSSSSPLDGLRWQEVFSGAEEALLTKDAGVADPEALRAASSGATRRRRRREALLPFLWQVLAKQGQLYGNADQGNVARVTNGHNFSYPGYKRAPEAAAPTRASTATTRIRTRTSPSWNGSTGAHPIEAGWARSAPGTSSRGSSTASAAGLVVNAGFELSDGGGRGAGHGHAEPAPRRHHARRGTGSARLLHLRRRPRPRAGGPAARPLHLLRRDRRRGRTPGATTTTCTPPSASTASRASSGTRCRTSTSTAARPRSSSRPTMGAAAASPDGRATARRSRSRRTSGSGSWARTRRRWARAREARTVTQEPGTRPRWRQRWAKFRQGHAGSGRAHRGAIRSAAGSAGG